MQLDVGRREEQSGRPDLTLYMQAWRILFEQIKKIQVEAHLYDNRINIEDERTFRWVISSACLQIPTLEMRNLWFPQIHRSRYPGRNGCNRVPDQEALYLIQVRPTEQVVAAGIINNLRETLRRFDDEAYTAALCRMHGGEGGIHNLHIQERKNRADKISQMWMKTHIANYLEHLSRTYPEQFARVD